MEFKEGGIFEHSRSFSRQAILQFAELTGDHGAHHTDHTDRIMAHGLLVASIVTKIGGDMNYISSDMSMEFREPVYEDEEITGRLTLVRVKDGKLRTKLEMKCEVLKADGTVVVNGSSRGQVLKKSILSRRKGI
ncbi:MAG: hypothetical protein RH862_18810 [Leptospiraceae bacterium]